jgi:cysteine desulfurase/selenocysteine lyase
MKIPSQENDRAGAAGAAAVPFDASRIRADFPALHQSIRGKPLVYVDNAATTQKPQAVIDALVHYYAFDNSNVHRGVHTLATRATEAYEGARKKVASFINAADPAEIVFVRGTTEGINLIARSFTGCCIRSGDEVLISAMEHHSNIVPWQILCGESGARLRVIPMDERGEILLDEYEKMLTPETRIVAVVHISNSLGTVNPVKEIVRRAHAKNIPVLVDGAQSVPHVAVDVRDMGCDFFVFSGHKMYGPMGIGVVYGKREILERMPPYQGGGDMIASVTFDRTTYNALPYKFEAGTPHVAGVVGLGAAIDYVRGFGFPAIEAHEKGVTSYAIDRLRSIPGLRPIGTAAERASVVSFVIDGIHPHDVGTILDREGIAVRTGHHCTQPVMDFFGVPATTRASFGIYNTREDVDSLVAALLKVKEVFA